MDTTNLAAFVEQLRASRPVPIDVPMFEPGNGNKRAKFLLVLEAPGSQAIESGIVSIENQNPTARNLKELLKNSKIDKSEIAIWNIVPWYVGSEDRSKLKKLTISTCAAPRHDA